MAKSAAPKYQHPSESGVLERNQETDENPADQALPHQDEYIQANRNTTSRATLPPIKNT
jgi:hypothetical protein